MLPPTPTSIRHEVLALALEGMWQMLLLIEDEETSSYPMVTLPIDPQGSPC